MPPAKDLVEKLKNFDLAKIEDVFGAQRLYETLVPDVSYAPVKRVAMFCETFLPKIDGVSQTAYLTLRYLQESGREVRVFAPDTAPPQIGDSKVVKLTSFSLPMYPEVRLAMPISRMYYELDQFKPDIIHLFAPAVMSMGAVLSARAKGIPIVANYQTDIPSYAAYYGFGYLRGASHWLFRQLHNRSEINLAPSLAMLNDLREWGYQRLRYWRHGVDNTRFNPRHKRAEWRERLLNGRDPNSLLCIYVGRLAKEKSIDELVQIAREPGMALTIVGDGTVRAELEAAFAGTNAYFTGYITGDDLSAAFASADVFTFASRTETFGLVVQEAMASGLPTIVRRGGGVTEIVNHGVDGFICDSVEEMVAAVRLLRDDRAKREAMAAEARRVVERYSWAAVMAQLEGYYNEAVQFARQRVATNGYLPAS